MGFAKYKGQKNLRVNVGCGLSPLEGFVNLDTDQDFAPLTIDGLFSSGSLEVVNISGVLPGLKLIEARQLFIKLFKLLESGGKVSIESFDLGAMVSKILGDFDISERYLDRIGALTGFSVEDLESAKNSLPRQFFWTSSHLRRELELAGFSEVKIVDAEGEDSFRVEAKRLSNIVLDSLRIELPRSFPRILFLLDPELGHTTVQVRGLIHKELFRENGWNVEFVNVRQVPENEIVEIAKNFDVVYLLKVAFLNLVNRLKMETKCKVVFDLTDALWKPYHVIHGWQDLDAILAKVDYIFSENEFICRYGRRFNSVYSIPAVTHPDRLNKLKSSLNKNHLDQGVRIGWVGSTGTVQALLNIKDVLIKILKKYPDVELRIVGCKDSSLLIPFEGLNISVRGDYNEEEMLEELVTFDIGIYPAPVDEEDYALRGAQKAMLYMQAGVPPVALALGDCATLIKDGVNGMLVYNSDDWLDKLDRLISNPILRKQIGERASADIGQNYSHSRVFQILCQGLEMVHGL